jgi:hypothetical protein
VRREFARLERRRKSAVPIEASSGYFSDVQWSAIRQRELRKFLVVASNVDLTSAKLLRGYLRAMRREAKVGESLWEFQHSAECQAPREFAWKYWTNPENWDDPPARFEFDGPFAVGTRLTTVLPGQRLESVIREIVDERDAVIEMEVMGARVRFRWRFEDLAADRTRFTQEICLFGEGGAELVEQAKGLEQSVPQGMEKLARAIELGWLADAGNPHRTT